MQWQRTVMSYVPLSVVLLIKIEVFRVDLNLVQSNRQEAFFWVPTKSTRHITKHVASHAGHVLYPHQCAKEALPTILGDRVYSSQLSTAPEKCPAYWHSYLY